MSKEIITEQEIPIQKLKKSKAISLGDLDLRPGLQTGGDYPGLPGGKGEKGKHQSQLKSKKKVGSDKSVLTPGDAKPDAPITKKPKTDKTGETKIGIFEILQQLNKKIGIQKGKKKAYGPEIPAKIKQKMLLDLKRKVDKEGLRYKLRQIFSSAMYLFIDNQYALVSWGSDKLDSQYYSGDAGKIRGVLNRAAELLKGESESTQGLVKIIAILEVKKEIVSETPQKLKPLVKRIIQDIENEAFDIDESFANHLDSSLSKEEYNRFYKAFLAEYKKELLQYMPDTLSVLEKFEEEEPSVATQPTRQRESKIMNKDDIKLLIKEAFIDKVYGKYPYSHQAGDKEEPKEDYIETWKKFCLGITQDKSKERAITLAKILVKDLELFEDVLDLAGQNQSIGSEILKKMEKAEKDMV